MTAVRQRWDDELAAYVVAQWGSGMTQLEIARSLGYANSTLVCVHCERFIRKYTNAPVDARGLVLRGGKHRSAFAKKALANFLASRAA